MSVAGDIQSLLPLAGVLVALFILLIIGGYVVLNVSQQPGINGTSLATNIASSANTAFTTLGSFATIIAIVMVAAIILGVLMTRLVRTAQGT